ncbi:MAG: hypothetical protein HPY82_21505 [Gammaproteobacteria bacterium]|nr:hypothetical protein [Gammaproteobacteria bacterium]
MQTKLHFSLIVASLLLGGCTVNPADCDPTNRDASIIAKTRCTSSGAYDVRVQAKQNILLDEQKTNQMFRDLYAAVEKEKSEVSAELRGKRSEYGALQKALGALLTEIKSKAKGNKEIEAEVAALEQQLATVTGQNDPVVLQKQQQLDELKNRAVKLEQDLGLRE